MAYGRGGAGNIQQLAEGARRMTELSAQDVEANETLGDAEREQRDAATTSSIGSEYAHMGRGGAGNWYSPPTLAASGQFVSSADNNATSPIVGRDATNAEPQGESRRMGRGGAGNFVWETEAERKAEAEKKRKEEAILEDTMKDVEAGLAKPGKAVLKAEIVKE